MAKRVPAEEARDGFSDLLGLVHYSKEAVIVEKRGRPFAVIVSPEDYEKVLREREADFAIFDEPHAKNQNVTLQEAEEDAMREVADSRGERRLTDSFGESWRLGKPLPINIESDENGEYLVSDDLFLVYGQGETIQAATHDYLVSLLEYYDLVARSNNLLDQAELQRLQDYIIAPTTD